MENRYTRRVTNAMVADETLGDRTGRPAGGFPNQTPEAGTGAWRAPSALIRVVPSSTLRQADQPHVRAEPFL